MNEVVREWVAKAEGDYNTGLREWRARKNRNHDAVCFHAQQCIEKYLKGFLEVNRIPFAKTHDLAVLLKLCVPLRPLWAAWEPDLKMVSGFAVQFRYPGESAVKEDAQKAVAATRRYRGRLREALGLSA
ncbi:HEPN domain-containing protein [Verrucomicrobiota bacterium]